MGEMDGDAQNAKTRQETRLWKQPEAGREGGRTICLLAYCSFKKVRFCGDDLVDFNYYGLLSTE